MELIFAYSAGLRYPLQPTIWPTFTRVVSRASAVVAVQHSNVAFSVATGTVWKWSNNQIESQDPASAALATLVIDSHAWTGSLMWTRSIFQPCGTKTPKRAVILEAPTSRTCRLQATRPRRVELLDLSPNLVTPARQPTAGVARDILT